MVKVGLLFGGAPISPSAMGSGQVSVNSISQTFYYSGVSSGRFWFAGNGVSSVLVNSATISQGAKSIPIRVNAAESFYVPSTGRWSDIVSISDFTLPGYVTITVVYPATASAPTFYDYVIPADPVAVSVIDVDVDRDPSPTTGHLLMDLQFEGTTEDSINGFTPSLVNSSLNSSILSSFVRNELTLS